MIISIMINIKTFIFLLMLVIKTLRNNRVILILVNALLILKLTISFKPTSSMY